MIFGLGKPSARHVKVTFPRKKTVLSDGGLVILGGTKEKEVAKHLSQGFPLGQIQHWLVLLTVIMMTITIMIIVVIIIIYTKTIHTKTITIDDS